MPKLRHKIYFQWQHVGSIIDTYLNLCLCPSIPCGLLKPKVFLQRPYFLCFLGTSTGFGVNLPLPWMSPHHPSLFPSCLLGVHLQGTGQICPCPGCPHYNILQEVCRAWSSLTPPLDFLLRFLLIHLFISHPHHLLDPQVFCVSSEGEGGECEQFSQILSRASDGTLLSTLFNSPNMMVVIIEARDTGPATPCLFVVTMLALHKKKAMAFVPPVYCPIDLSKQILTVHVLYKKTSKCGPKSGLKVFFLFSFFF